VNKHATLRKDASILSRHWLFVFTTNNPIRIDPLIAENVTIAMMIDKIFKMRSPIGRFCDTSEIFFGRMRLTTPEVECKISE